MNIWFSQKQNKHMYKGILGMYLNGTLSRRELCSVHTFFFCLHICMSRQSQILFLSDVGIFLVHDCCATQTRPRFDVPPVQNQR